MNAGITVALDIDHTQYLNTTLRVVDAAGNVIAANDDSPSPDLDAGSTVATDSALSFVAPATGTYYFEVGNHVGVDDIGPIPGSSSYTLQVAVVDTPDLYAGSGADTLDGGSGADYMYGGAGNDLYIVDNAGDRVFERAGEGKDRVLTTVSYALAAGQAIEELTTRSSLDTHAIDLTGNEFANTLYGGAGDNVLDGGAGVDALYGRGGDDTYLVDNASDRVIEARGAGNDTVIASASYTLAPGQEIETLEASATPDNRFAAVDLTGNEFDNTLIGNYGSNVIDGGSGADTMIGSPGDYFGNNGDSFYIDNPDDKIIGYGGNVFTTISYALGDETQRYFLSAADIHSTNAINLTGSIDLPVYDQLGDKLIGNDGDNIFDGRGGYDTYTGNGGADTFILHSIATNYYQQSINAIVITDFANSSNAVHDTILLHQSDFYGLGDTVTPDVFSSGVETADTRLFYTVNPGDGYGTLYYDQNGSGYGQSYAIAYFSGAPTLSAADFTVG